MKQTHRWLSSLAAFALILTLVLPVAPVAAAPATTRVPAASPDGPAPAQCATTNATATEASAPGRGLWQRVAGESVAPGRPDAQRAINPRQFQPYRLNRSGMTRLLAGAPTERSARLRDGMTIALPNPCGGFERFTIQESPVMEPGLAAKHPDIKTYRGRGVDDPAATIRFDLTPLGFHASVRSPKGAWYIDPYFHLDQSLYASYFGRDLSNDPNGMFVERGTSVTDLTLNRSELQPAETVTLNGSGFAPNATITITISDPEENFAEREVRGVTDGIGMFTVEFEADPSGNLETHIVQVTDGAATAYASYQVVTDAAAAPQVSTGGVLRVYRLALITDPGYAAFHGGSANVTPAKVTLMNRVNQLYEDDLSIRMVLIENNDLLNFDTWGEAIGPNGRCGAAACFSQSQVTGCQTGRMRYVISQIIGASNYDIGHLALGQPGGGVANLGVVGRGNKAGGCTGIPTPTGDYYAVDYVAHEMGHQFSGNHPFNGNQLNCSGGNRSAANSVEPGSGSSVMAYAGICLTDDLQRHSDPYFSQRSLQEISNYTASDQNAANEAQTVSLRHFGGGNEVQVVTFGPGYSAAATIQPLSVSINAAPGAASLGGATEDGNTVTIAAAVAHTLQPGDVVTIAGVGVAEYNGTWTVDTVPTTRSFTFTHPVSGLARSGGGTVTLAAPGATQDGTTVTIRTAAAHGRSVGDVVTIASTGVVEYRGTWTITAVPSPRSFQYENTVSGLAASGGGTATYYSPFQVRIGGADSSVIGGSGLPYNATNIQDAINAIPGFAGTVTVTGAAATGFTVTYGGASAGADAPSIDLVNLNCGGCYASVEETNHGGAFDSFTLSYNGVVSAPIVNGTNYNQAGLSAALTSILPAGATFTLSAFGGGNISGLNNTGFMVTFTGALAATNLPLLGAQDFTPDAWGWVGETDKGGPVDNKGGPLTVPVTGNTAPTATAPVQYTIPLRTPFSLTGLATDAEGDAMLYSWEQNDRGGTAGTSLLNNTKTNGALFAMFPQSGEISDEASLQYNSPGQNHLTASPMRVFPDMQQILANNTNAETGACPMGPIAPFAAKPVKECYAEFLPTADYVGYSTTNFNNADPLSLHFRFTARDGNGGVNSADTTLLLAKNAGPFLITAPNAAGAHKGGSTQTITWDPANTNAAPVSAANVKITLSTDGGQTFPIVLAESTPNDGSEALTLANVSTTTARVKIEAVDNIFFDVSNADFEIEATPVVVTSVGEGGSQPVQYSDALSPDLTITASDADTAGKDLIATATGLPQGLALTLSATSDDATRPGSRAWKVDGLVTAAPGSYPVTVTVTDEKGGAVTTAFTIVVAPEDAEITYTGDMLLFTKASGASTTAALRATVRDSAAVAGSGDALAGDIRNATVTFKEGGATLCGPLAVALINGDPKTGTASCPATLGLGAHQIDVYVNNYYTGVSSELVEVAAPDGSYITGGGFTNIANSGGSYKATPGSRMNVGFNVTYKNAKVVKGHATFVFRKDGRRYQIKSTAIDTVGITKKAVGGVAEFRSRAILSDVTNPAAPVNVKGGLTLQVTLTDKGEPGTNDTIGVTLWDGSKLVFSSEWTGARTLEKPLTGGNLMVK